MTRRHALFIALIAAAVFAVVYFWPESAQAGVTGRLHLGDGGVQAEIRLGDRPRWRHRHRRRDDWRRPVVIVPSVRHEQVVIHQTVVAPRLPAPVPQAAPPPPLNPHGRARSVAAGGVEPPREWVLGEVVPAHLPRVTLDPAAYGLPQPPPGQLYARIDGDVLRIEAGSRRIVAVVAR